MWCITIPGMKGSRRDGTRNQCHPNFALKWLCTLAHSLRYRFSGLRELSFSLSSKRVLIRSFQAGHLFPISHIGDQCFLVC